MRKILLTFALVCFAASLMAGGLVTNTNQSAAWTRLMCRGASLDVDAVYYNPAGTVMMDKGLHFSVSNQTITQTRWINTNFPLLDGVTPTQTKEYIGDVFAPAFPSIYGVYNLGKIAVSAAFNPIGGGGGATFSDGLPRIEYDPSLIAYSLSGAGVTGYDLEAKFEASSIYFGYQLNVAYKINDMISIAVGGRMVTAKNTYNGYLRNVNLDFLGTPTGVADVFTALSGNASGAAASVQPIIDGGGGDFTLAQLVGAGQLLQAQADALEAGLQGLGIDPTGYTAAQVQGAYTAAATDLAGKSVVYGGLMNQEAEVLQTATGFAPVISVNIQPIDMLNIAIKYEGKTSLKFKNETTSDFVTAVDPLTGAPTASMFPNGYEYNADMPALLSVAAMLRPTDRLMLTAGFTTYFDQPLDYSQGLGIDLIDKNFFSYSVGAEFGLTDALGISAGYSGTVTGVNELYQNDMTHSLNTSSFGGGFVYSVGSLLDINIGAAFTSYAEETYDKVKTPPVGTPISYQETYDRGVWLVGIGVDLHF
ncbi:MAG: hypothetical protein V2I37_12335 [Marinilabiliaceae bacterium]|nr:hypothetical protein [Marinilabiliaceae bacterium]